MSTSAASSIPGPEPDPLFYLEADGGFHVKPLHSNESDPESEHPLDQVEQPQSQSYQERRRARDEREAQAYVDKYLTAPVALLDDGWCVAHGWGHLDPALWVQRLPGGR